MPQDVTPDNEQNEQLVMRGYRRHRRHSRLGLAALFCPVVAILWAMFWYLMMQQVSPVAFEVSASTRTERMFSQTGCVVLGVVGIALSLIGLMNRRRRHHLASAGLIVNITYLLVLGMLIWFGAF